MDFHHVLVVYKNFKATMAELRELKHDIYAYIDDMFLQGKTKTKCVSNIVTTIKSLRSLGFTIHAEKSNLNPTQKLDILGFTIDSVAMTPSLKGTKKKDNLSNLISKTIAKTFIKLRKLSQVIGKIVAALPGSMSGALYYRHIELNKQHGLKHTKENYEVYVRITKESVSELTCWKENLPSMYQKINHESPTVTSYSDASNLGWGAYMRDQSTGGNWSVNEVTYHINIPEMLAVKFVLKSFVKKFSNVSIKIFIDNTTVISVLKNMGTFHDFHMKSICKQIWEWCKDRNVCLFPVYIKTKDNLADRSSRITYIQAEWMLEK